MGATHSCQPRGSRALAPVGNVSGGGVNESVIDSAIKIATKKVGGTDPREWIDRAF